MRRRPSGTTRQEVADVDALDQVAVKLGSVNHRRSFRCSSPSIEKSSHHIDKGYTVSIAEVIEGHIRDRMLREKDRECESAAAEELTGIVHSCLT
jgi:hypothetical protein